MNEETNEDLINWIKDKIDGVEGFAIEQAPLYAQELISYEIVSGILMVSIFSFIITAIWGCFLFLYKRIDEYDKIYWWTILLSVTIFLIIPVVCGIDALIKANYAPRVLIMEKLTETVK